MDYHNRCLGCMNEKEAVETCTHCGYTEGTAPESVQHLSPGIVLKEKYLIGRVLGQGGFGITYLAWDLNLNIKLAIKEFMPQNLATRETGRNRVITFKETLSDQFHYGLDKFLQEARTLAQFIELPNVVSVRDYYLDNGTAYLVMNYIEGVTLRKYLKLIKRPVSFSEARNMFLPIFGALSVMHEKGVLHRDISPDNVLIGSNGQLTLIDFGSARQAISGWQHNLSVVMKPGFSPEEQYRSNGIQGPWTDVYAVAATLYWLITGQKPPDSLDRLAEETLVAPSFLEADIGLVEERALLKALSINADNRYQRMMDFQDALIGSLIEPAEQMPSVLHSTIDQNVKNVQFKNDSVIWLVAGLMVLVLAGTAILMRPANTANESSYDEPLLEAPLMEQESAYEPVVKVETAGNTSVNVSTPPRSKQTINEIAVPEDYQTIQTAIDAASSGSIIIVDPGIYYENIDFRGKSIIVRSSDPADPDVVALTVIDGGGRGTAVAFRQGESRSAVLSGFTIRGGSGTIDSYVITSYDNEKLSFRRRYGGGILISGKSSPTIINNVVTGNSVKKISNQDIGVGGGIAVLDNSSPLIENNIIKNNSAEGYGGGIAVWYRSSPTIRNNDIIENRADQIGGGILVAMMCNPEISGNYISKNSSDRSGGLYIAHMSSARVYGNTFKDNIANLGAGLFIWRTESVEVKDNSFTGNMANQRGAAIYLGNKAFARIIDNRFENNVSSGKGGAAWVSRDSEASSVNNSFINNKPDNIFQE